MDFERLYAPELNLLLNTSDSNVLFTTALRQQAVNDGLQEFAALTECYQLKTTIQLSCSVTEYSISTLTGFVRVAATPPVEYWHTSSGLGSSAQFTMRAGYDFPQVTELWLDRYSPGWRQSTATVTAPSSLAPTIRPVVYPRAYYLRAARLQLIGLSDPPDVGSSESVQLAINYIARPEAMASSTDIPFTDTNGFTRTDLTEYHQAFAHYAAYKLLPLQGRVQEAAANLQIFQSYIERYKGNLRPRGGQHVTFARDYLRGARRGSASGDASIANDPTWRWS